MSRIISSTPVFDFTQDWFTQHIPVWQKLLPSLPSRKKFLEIGSFEGLSACWLLENAIAEDGALYCMDTWQGSPEFHVLPHGIVDESWDRFQRNIKVARGPKQSVKFFRNTSVHGLSSLMLEHHSTFDFAYIDGSHMATDVLTDACLAFALVRVGGLLVFDDYVWDLQQPIVERPKMAIDAFTTIYNDKLSTQSVGKQYIVRKVRP